MTTLQDLMWMLAVAITDTREGVITSVPSSTSVIDDDAPDHYEKWAGGTFFADGASSAGYTSRIGLNSLEMFAGLSSGSLGVGERYSLADAKYPIQVLRASVNEVLRSLNIKRIDETHTATDGVATLTGVSNVRRVFVDDVRSYQWEEIGGQIQFDDETVEGDLKIWYVAPHGALDAYTDELDASVDPLLVVTSAARTIWEREFRKNSTDNGVLNSLNKALQDEQRLMSAHVRKLPMLDPHLAGW